MEVNMSKRSLLLIATLIVAACAKEQTQSTATTASEAPPMTTASTAPAQALEIAQDLQTPESVLYDADQDVYFISNINGDPTAADNNGYISRVNPDTLKIEKFTEGGKNN